MPIGARLKTKARLLSRSFVSQRQLSKVSKLVYRIVKVAYVSAFAKNRKNKNVFRVKSKLKRKKLLVILRAIKELHVELSLESEPEQLKKYFSPIANHPFPLSYMFCSSL